MLRPARGQYLASKAKRLGEDCSFFGAFVVFCNFSAFFCAFCLEVKSFFVYLQPTKRAAVICHQECLSIKQYDIFSNYLILHDKAHFYTIIGGNEI